LIIRESLADSVRLLGYGGTAAGLFKGLTATIPGEAFTIDVSDASAQSSSGTLVCRFGLIEVFRTVRMYSARVPSHQVSRVFRPQSEPNLGNGRSKAMEISWTHLTAWTLRPTPFTAAVTFALFAAILGPLERLCRPFAAGRSRRPGLGTDLLFWVFTPLVGKAATYAAVMAVVAGLMRLTRRDLDPFSESGWGLIGRQSLWLQTFEVLLLADLIFYWTHRLFHTTRMWPFHAVHHSSEHLDWLSSMRFHPVNDIVSRVFQAVPLVLLGFAPAAVVCAIPVVVTFIVVTHANVPWTWGPFRHVFVSPVYHHWHHSTDPEAVDKNFAGVIVLWDWLFGTRYLPRDLRPARYGVAEKSVPRDFLGLLAYPFLTREATTSGPRVTPSESICRLENQWC
jgi:sterol desaturase/sphingolipid hydroxylase (fatty acid hydroxylase superfamily)